MEVRTCLLEEDTLGSQRAIDSWRWPSKGSCIGRVEISTSERTPWLHLPGTPACSTSDARPVEGKATTNTKLRETKGVISMAKEAVRFHLLAKLVLPEGTAVRRHLKESIYVDWQSCRGRQRQETEGASLDRSGHQPSLYGTPQSGIRCGELT